MAEDVGWLSRYRRGERAAVWHELRQLGSRVREPSFVREAELVCDEMARRARRNIEVVVERLSASGYRFHANDQDQQPVVPFVAATTTAAAHAQWLDDTFGPLPLTVLSWVRLVGDVWLVGTHPQAPDSAAADPLVIEIEGSRYPDASMRAFFTEELDVWREQVDDHEDAGLFALPVAPDRLHKSDVSGGLPYGLVVPDACADALFVGETTMPFVTYLNLVFAHGGFPTRPDRASAGGTCGGTWRGTFCPSRTSEEADRDDLDGRGGRGGRGGRDGRDGRDDLDE